METTARQPATHATASASEHSSSLPTEGAGAFIQAKASPMIVASASSNPRGTSPDAGDGREDIGAGLDRFPGTGGIDEGDEAVLDMAPVERTSRPTLAWTNWRRPGPAADADGEASVRSAPTRAPLGWRSAAFARSMREPRPFPKTRLDTGGGSVTAHLLCKSMIFTPPAFHTETCWAAKSRIFWATRSTVERRLSASCFSTPSSSRNLGSCAAISTGVRPL